jgi:hypothetical protein
MFVPVLEALQIGRRGPGRPRGPARTASASSIPSVNLCEDMIIG